MTDASHVDRTGGEIDWPIWADRTPSGSRERTAKFSVTLASAISDIETELEGRLGVDDWRLSTAARHRKKDGRPYADADPDDPGAVIRWTMDGEQFAVAADRYAGLRDNVRAIGLYLGEKRKMADRPVRTGQSEFATAKLPPGDDEEAIVATDDGTLDRDRAAELLGVRVDAHENAIRGAAERMLRRGHPDHGGDANVAEIQEARDLLLGWSR